MYGLLGDVGRIWDSLSSWTLPTQLLGVVFLGLFLVLHVVIVRLVVRPMNSSDHVVATRDSRVTRPSKSAQMLPADDRWPTRPGRRSHHVAHGPGPA